MLLALASGAWLLARVVALLIDASFARYATERRDPAQVRRVRTQTGMLRRLSSAGVAVVALAFPKFGDGRAYSYARLLRERFGFQGEVRAVGDVLREQAGFMVRCGFDAFEPADGSTVEVWERAAQRFRHVYQRSTDGRPPAFAERGG